MRKLALLLALLFGISTWFSAASLLCGTAQADTASVFVLPAALRTIEDEAFTGTAAAEVILPDSLAVIGERAFAGNRRLSLVSIPASVESIAEHAFEGSADLTIRGERDSYAAQWAREHDIAFRQAESVPAGLKKLGRLLGGDFFISLCSTLVCPCVSLRRRRRIVDAWRSMRPQDRSELYPIDYRFP